MSGLVAHVTVVSSQLWALRAIFISRVLDPE
jgi:hypothetical protein